MAVTYTIDADLRLIRTRCTRDTKLSEVLAHFAELKAIPSLPQPLDVHLDLTELVTPPGLEQVEAAAGSTASVAPKVRWGALAIVVATEAARETASLYAALIRYYFEDVQVFQDPAEAETWLAARRSGRTAGAVERSHSSPS